MGMAWTSPSLAANADPGSVVVLAKAQLIFEQIKNNPLYTFHLPEAGCESRSYVMKKFIESQGARVDSFVIVYNKGTIQIANSYAPGGKTDWSFHTTPLVYVMTDKGIVAYVIDPSLFAGPVPLSQILQNLDPRGQCQEIGIDLIGQRFSSNQDFSDDYGSGPCYWFKSSRYFYSPSVEEFTIHDQLGYTNWNDGFMQDSIRQMQDCQADMRARQTAVDSGQVPTSMASCLM